MMNKEWHKGLGVNGIVHGINKEETPEDKFRSRLFACLIGRRWCVSVAFFLCSRVVTRIV
jgi:hypothetical protein